MSIYEFHPKLNSRSTCINESVMGGEASYTELLTCLEMARDVRAMRLQQSKSSGDKKR